MKLEPAFRDGPVALVLSEGRNDGLASVVRIVQVKCETYVLYPSMSQQDFVKDETVANIKGESNELMQPTVAVLWSGGVNSSSSVTV